MAGKAPQPPKDWSDGKPSGPTAVAGEADEGDSDSREEDDRGRDRNDPIGGPAGEH